jgi:hypothetical protein
MATGVVTGEGVNGISFDELHRMTVDRYERLAESFGEDLLTPPSSSSRLFDEVS